MKIKKMPASIRKHIRKEKARIRREILDVKEREQKIQSLYAKFGKKRSGKE